MSKLSPYYQLTSPTEIEKFIDENEITATLLDSIEKPMKNYFPNSKVTLEVCDSLEWSDDTKLLVNVCVSEKMFFNGILENFNGIYKEIQNILDEYVSTIVLFPEIENRNLSDVKMNSNSTINLLARTAYFNTYNNYEIEKEITLRDIPKEQRQEEIIEYCKTHNIIYSWDISDELRLELEEVEEILKDLKNEGIIKEWE